MFGVTGDQTRSLYVMITTSQEAPHPLVELLADPCASNLRCGCEQRRSASASNGERMLKLAMTEALIADMAKCKSESCEARRSSNVGRAIDQDLAPLL